MSKSVSATILFASLQPTVLAQISVVGAGYRGAAPPSAAPGEVVTLSVTGLKTRIATPQSASTVPLPTTLAGISVTLNQGDRVPCGAYLSNPADKRLLGRYQQLPGLFYHIHNDSGSNGNPGAGFSGCSS